MGGSPVLADAARVKPPGTGNFNEVLGLGAGVASAAQDLFAPDGPDEAHLWISVIATNPFNILVGESDVADPSNLGYFGTGAALQFRVTRSKLPFMKVIMPLGGDFLWWNSGP